MQSYAEAVNAAIAAFERRDLQQSLTIFDKLAQMSPDDPQAVSGMAGVLMETGFNGAALALLSYAVVLRKDSPELWANLGGSLRRAGHTAYARAALEKSLALAPDNVDTLVNMSGAFVNEGEPEAGLPYAEKSVALAPDHPKARHNLAFLLLELGRWAEAWPHWWHRQLGGGSVPRTYPGFRWRGETVDTLVIHGEQGIGDEVMFLAYADEAWLRPLARRVVIEVTPRLRSIAARAFPWAEVIGTPADFDGDGDAWVSMADLPGIYSGAAPVKRSGYLKPDPERVARWRERLPAGAVLLAHKGGTERSHETVRNPPREAWAPLIETGRPVLSIQYGRGAEEHAAEIGVPWLQEAAEDLEEQIAAIAACDVLVSVPQAALHFGGAVGKRVLCPLTDKPAWRYGVAGDMPWYRTVELFRRAPGEEWAAVVRRVAGAL